MINQEMVAKLKNIRDLYPWGEDSYKTLDYAVRAVVELPKRRKEVKMWRAKAHQPKTGHWITEHFVWECDKCHWQQKFNTNFCPNCGADMRDKERDND